MKSALVILLLVAVAAAREHVTSRYMMPPGGERFMRAVKAAMGCKDYECRHRVVGGAEAVPHSRPFQVGLFLTVPGGRAFCGGSLLNSEWVMTAAHCIWDGQTVVSEFEIVLGAHNIYDVAGTTRYTSQTAMYHPSWTPTLLRNDIGLIRIPAQVSTSDRIQFVNLPPRSAEEELFTGFLGTVSGWGKITDASQTIADNLHEVDVEVMTNFLCNIRYPAVIQPEHICTTGNNGKGACSGDSGGPLTVNHEGTDIQVGIVSFGLALGCEIGWPSAYARVTSYLDWLSETAGVTIN